MVSNSRSRLAFRYVRTHWPTYFALYGTLVLAVLLIGVSLANGWYSFVPFCLAIVLVAAYFLAAYVFLAYQLVGPPDRNTADSLYQLSQIRPNDHVVCVDLGLRETAIEIARHLTTGEVFVVDVYNPQSNDGAAHRRARKIARKPPSDPRLNWIDGTVSLLPLPDHSVEAVFMNQILSEFWLPEEQDALLHEIMRVLVPEGRLLIAERVRSQSNLLLTGIVTWAWPSAGQWSSMLKRAGFEIRPRDLSHGLLYVARADKPSAVSGKQMELSLEFV